MEWGILLEQLTSASDGDDVRAKSIHFPAVVKKDDIALADDNYPASVSASVSGAIRKDGIDPTKFYKTLVNINVMNVGDAGTSLRSILGRMREALEEILVDASTETTITNTNTNTNTKDESQSSTKQIYEIVQTIHKQLLESFWSGRTSHEIIGSKLIQDGNGNGSAKTFKAKCTRRKEKKERDMSCPLPISVKGYTSIEASLRSVMAGSQTIIGYDWDSQDSNNYTEEIVRMDEDMHIDEDVHDVNIVAGLENVHVTSSMVDSDGPKLHGASRSSLGDTSNKSADSDSDDSSTTSSSSSLSSSSSSSSSLASSLDNFDQWRTKKVICPFSLPKVLILQLSRSEFKGGRVQLIPDAIHVPYSFEVAVHSNLHSIFQINKVEYTLMGAVVHTDRGDASSLDREEDYIGTGHYVTYMKEIRNDHACPDDDHEVWIKMDDEKVTTFLVGVGVGSAGQVHQKIISRNALCALFGGMTKRRNNFATLLMYKEK